MMHRSNRIQTRFLAAFVLILICQPAASSEGNASGSPLSPDRAYLGFSMGLEQLEEKTQAIRVVQPVAGSPADLAGLQNGDLVTSVNGEPVAVSDLFHLLREMDKFKAGEVLQLRIRRGDEVLTFDVKSTSYSPADFERLNRWLVMMEGRQRASSRSGVGSGAQCGSGARGQDEASHRWSVFLLKTMKGSESAILTIRRPEIGASLTFEVSPPSIRLPNGFIADDLPSGMRKIVEQLRMGDTMSYRLESLGREFHIQPLGKFPSYIRKESKKD